MVIEPVAEKYLELVDTTLSANREFVDEITVANYEVDDLSMSFQGMRVHIAKIKNGTYPDAVVHVIREDMPVFAQTIYSVQDGKLQIEVNLKDENSSDEDNEIALIRPHEVQTIDADDGHLEGLASILINATPLVRPPRHRNQI